MVCLLLWSVTVSVVVLCVTGGVLVLVMYTVCVVYWSLCVLEVGGGGVCVRCEYLVSV